MKKNGFVSTSLIYTFFVIFLMLMIFLLNSYSSNRFLLENIKYDIKNSFAYLNSADINLYVYVWDKTTHEYELKENMPVFGFEMNENVSYCKNGSTINYVNGNLVINASRKDSCYAYFDEVESDIIINIYTKNTSTSERVKVDFIPDYSYEITSSSCTNDAVIEFNEEVRKFNVTASKKTVCEVEFTKREADVLLHIYKQSVLGNKEVNGIKYLEIEDNPGYGYDFATYECIQKEVETTIRYENGEIVVDTAGKNECSVYFNGTDNTINLIIMQETTNGLNGYTTGKKYSRSYVVPTDNYKYVGYLCEDNRATVKYENGILVAEGSVETTCRAYFDHYSGNYFIHQMLERTDGTYEEVSVVPILGYNYNESKSSCKKGSTITVVNNTAYISGEEDDACTIYYDLLNKDIVVNVYVMDRVTHKYELSKVPVIGYELLSKSCTNDAQIEYINGGLKVSTISPTVCTVYFR